MMKIKYLGKQEYLPVFEAMRTFTEKRLPESADELWVVEHFPVFTQGKAGKPEHLLFAGGIPVVQTDRGGQITYHGPGQIVVYTLVDFARRAISVHELVCRIENAVIATLADYGIAAEADEVRPGVYVAGKKIASLGLRIRRNAVYHGLALNLDMDLTPFTQINPCGYAGMQMCRIADFVAPCPDFDTVAAKLCAHLQRIL